MLMTAAVLGLLLYRQTRSPTALAIGRYVEAMDRDEASRG
jgi:hypothetical protein